MAVVQQAFYIPENIMMKLQTGELVRYGGVVRSATGATKGQIHSFLKPIDYKKAEEAHGVGFKVTKFATKNLKGLIIGAAVGAAAGVGIIIATAIYKARNENSVVAEMFLKIELRIYLKEIREGNLKLDTIKNLLAALEMIKAQKNCKQIKLELSAEDLDVIVSNTIYNYTIQLAKDNQIELTEQERSNTNNSIINLQNYLEAQKRIFEEVS